MSLTITALHLRPSTVCMFHEHNITLSLYHSRMILNFYASICHNHGKLCNRMQILGRPSPF